MKSCRVVGRWMLACGLLLGVWLLAGCASPKAPAATDDLVAPPLETTEETLKPGDALTVNFSDLPGSASTQMFKDRIKEDGTITLLLNQPFTAAGKKRGELEKEIRSRYVPKYYVNLTVTIEPQDQLYFVGGEVRGPNRFPYIGKMTVLKAIQSAGDFTDFANKKKVQLTRINGRSVTINCVKALRDPSLDLPVYPGDKIHVPRRW